MLQHLSYLFTTAGLIVSSYLGNHHTVISSQSTNPAVTTQDVSNDSFYYANRSITYDGYTVAMSVSVPKNGGNITGNIFGDCNGKITGQYDGQNNGAINGQANVTCSLLFVSLPAAATFTGTVDKTNNTAQLHVTLNVDTLHKTEQVVVPFN